MADSASPWDANWGLGAPAAATPTTTTPASTWATDPWAETTSNPWTNPMAGQYEGGGGDPRMAGNAQGISDWKTAVRNALAPNDPNADPIQLIQKLLSNRTDGHVGPNYQALGNLQRTLEANGMDKYTSTNLVQMFGSGAEAEQSAYRMGAFQQFHAGGQNGLHPIGNNTQNFQNQFTQSFDPSGNPNYTGKYDPSWNAFSVPKVNMPLTPNNSDVTPGVPAGGIQGAAATSGLGNLQGGAPTTTTPAAPYQPGGYNTPIVTTPVARVQPYPINPFQKNPFGLPRIQRY